MWRSVLKQLPHLALHLLHKGGEAGVQQTGPQEGLQVARRQGTVAVHQRQGQALLTGEVLRDIGV